MPRSSKDTLWCWKCDWLISINNLLENGLNLGVTYLDGLWLSMQVKGVLRRTICSDWCFNILSRSYFQPLIANNDLLMKHFWNLFIITLCRKKLRFKFTLLRFEASFNFSCVLGDWHNSDVEERLIRLEKHVFGKGDNHEWHDHAVKKILMMTTVTSTRTGSASLKGRGWYDSAPKLHLC